VHVLPELLEVWHGNELIRTVARTSKRRRPQEAGRDPLTESSPNHHRDDFVNHQV
jgi:hypothetical protein